MALIACRECGKSVSDQALSCPHCGYPLKEDPVLDYAERRVRFGYVMAWIIMGLGGLLTVGTFVSEDLIALAVGCIGLGILTLIAIFCVTTCSEAAKSVPDRFLGPELLAGFQLPGFIVALAKAVTSATPATDRRPNRKRAARQFSQRPYPPVSGESPPAPRTLPDRQDSSDAAR